jgi:hypothetical protein
VTAQKLTISELDDLLPAIEPSEISLANEINAEPVGGDLPPWLTDRLAEPPNGDRSIQTIRAAAACRRAGLTDGQIVMAMRRHKPTIEKYGARADDEVRRAISNLGNARHAGAPDDDANDAAPELDPSWRRVDLTPALRGEVVRVTPTVFRRDDGARLFYRSRVNYLHSDSGDGKSMLLAFAAAQELQADHDVGWADFEDNEQVIVERLRMFGADDDAIAERFHYHRPTAPFDDAAVAEITHECREHDVTLFVIDSIGEASGSTASTKTATCKSAHGCAASPAHSPTRGPPSSSSTTARSRKTTHSSPPDRSESGQQSPAPTTSSARASRSPASTAGASN